jgi:uncharacterized protein YjbI with pentapeptide repeats
MPTIPGFEMKTIDLSKVVLPFKLPFDLPKIDLPTIDLSKVELPDLPFDLPKVDFSKVDFSKLNLNGLNLANVELPNIDLPTAEQVIDFFKDATLAGSGLVSLTAEKVAELQKQLVEALKAQIEKVRAAV